MKNKILSYQGTSTLEVLEGADNYNAWIAKSIQDNLFGKTLEIGAGTGNITNYFRKLKNFVITDTDKVLVSHLKKRFGRYKNITVERMDILTLYAPYKNTFSSAFAVNVFEHLQDDVKGLKNAHALLKRNGKLVLLVPAKRFAFTKLDKNLGHFRRYEKDELKGKLEQAGFVVEKIYFFNIVGLLSWMVRDKIEKNHVQLDSSQIAVFDKIVPLLRFIESFVPVPIGISLIAIAKKK